MGRLKNGDVVFASESCALDAISAKFERDIQPGEIVVVDKSGVRSDARRCGSAQRKLCVFEFIYFARPDSVIDGSSVQTARQRAGAFLALDHPVQADVVVGVPDSGLDAALGYARQSGIPYAQGFIKNKYIGRTFISPTQAMRESEVNIKLNPIRSAVEGKRVVLVDDSIVRGTTSRRIVNLLRAAGAKEVHMKKYGIPTADYTVFNDPKAALEYLKTAKYPTVVKADGLALGKGVLIPQTYAEAESAVKAIMEDKVFGASGNEIVIEEFLTGPEVSVLAFTDGTAIAPMRCAGPGR